MENKFNMNVNDNILFAKRNLVDSIYKSAHLEGISVTYPQTQIIIDGGNIAELKVDEVVTINNLKHAWQFMLNDIDIPNNFAYLQELHKIVGSNLIIRPGELRSTPVSIGGTNWKPTLPFESQIKEDLDKILSINNPTDRSITLMLWIMRSQMFYDGNKRVAMLFANKIMIENGCGIIEIPVERQTEFYTLLIEYYETNNNKKIKDYIYSYCIDGLDLN